MSRRKPNQIDPKTSQDDRILAALSHVAVIVPMVGIIAPIVIWVTQKVKSRYVAFQSLQAIVYQLVIIILYMGGMFIYMLAIFLTMILGSVFSALSNENPSDGETWMMLGFIVPFLVFGLVIVAIGFLILYGLWGSYRVFQGREFRYALLGRRLESYLSKTAEKDQEMEGFPEPIRKLPLADIPLPGITAYLSQSETHQILFMHFNQDVDLPEHAHAGQWGVVLDGQIDLVIEGSKFTFYKGDRYFIPENARHSGKIYTGYADITFFNQPDRYPVKTS